MCTCVCPGSGGLALQFSVLVLVRVGGVVSWHPLLLRLLSAVAEGTSPRGGLKSVGFRAGAGAGGGTMKIQTAISPEPLPLSYELLNVYVD